MVRRVRVLRTLFFIRLSLSGSGANEKVIIHEHSISSSGGEFTGVFSGGSLLFRKAAEGNDIYKLATLLENSSVELSQALTAGQIISKEIRRPDLLTKVYPFRWVQGDYNGDSKTDVGIFHVSEPVWYFAMTRGTVPDLLERVDNGIGGFYRVEYENSSGFDNTGEDDIPDLSVNYKVVTRLVLNDGRNNEIVSRYQYGDGFAFSDYIDGKKETDYFGFSSFEKEYANGQKEVSRYYTTPYADHRFNRSLAGAVKEKRSLGSDLIEYSRELYTYEPLRLDEQSYYVNPASVVMYSRGHRKETKTVDAFFRVIHWRGL